jgi:hypothetical protein
MSAARSCRIAQCPDFGPAERRYSVSRGAETRPTHRRPAARLRAGLLCQPGRGRSPGLSHPRGGRGPWLDRPGQGEWASRVAPGRPLRDPTRARGTPDDSGRRAEPSGSPGRSAMWAGGIRRHGSRRPPLCCRGVSATSHRPGAHRPTIYGRPAPPQLTSPRCVEPPGAACRISSMSLGVRCGSRCSAVVPNRAERRYCRTLQHPAWHRQALPPDAAACTRCHRSQAAGDSPAVLPLCRTASAGNPRSAADWQRPFRASSGGIGSILAPAGGRVSFSHTLLNIAEPLGVRLRADFDQ